MTEVEQAEPGPVFHPLLERQIQRHLGGSGAVLSSVTAPAGERFFVAAPTSSSTATAA